VDLGNRRAAQRELNFGDSGQERTQPNAHSWIPHAPSSSPQFCPQHRRRSATPDDVRRTRGHRQLRYPDT